jgi:hypothetical protein
VDRKGSLPTLLDIAKKLVLHKHSRERQADLAIATTTCPPAALTDQIISSPDSSSSNLTTASGIVVLSDVELGLAVVTLLLNSAN